MNMHKHSYKFNKRQQGLTLIEIMVAMALSLFLLGGVIQIFSSSKQTYRLQDAAARVQESGRFALHFLVKDIRMADFWGCMGEFGTVINHLNPGAGNPFDAMLGGISGTDNDGLNGSDTLSLFGGVPGGVQIETHSVNAASFGVSEVTTIEQFDYLLASDCVRTDLMQRTNINNDVNAVVANTGVGSPGNATKPNLAYSGDNGGRIYEFQGTLYSLGTGSGGEPSLFRTINGGTPQELVEGIENMQILYGEDTDNDNAANVYVAAGSVSDWDRVMSIRVTLTVRSAENNVAEANNGDRRLRRTFSTTTTIRNRVT